MSPRHPWILSRSRAVLCVIDLQESLVKAVWEADRVVAAARLLIEGCKTLDVPILATTQYARRLGGLVGDVGPREPIDKMAFSCAAHPDFREALAATGRDQVLLCGVETHICVQQTALDLLHQGYQVHCAADAVSARSV